MFKMLANNKVIDIYFEINKVADKLYFYGGIPHIGNGSQAN